MKSFSTFAAAIAAGGFAAALAATSALTGCGSTAPGALYSAGGNTFGGDTGGDTGGETNGGTNGGTTGTASPDGGTVVTPRPDAGPGSTASAARAYFLGTAYPKLSSTCGSCHTSGAQGAPKFLDANPEAAYVALDGRALIVADSLLLNKGPHAGGGAPALAGDALTVTQTWLTMEAGERQGKPGPTNILQVAADCADSAKFPTTTMTQLVTTRRQNENANNCIGCSNTQCASCHLAEEANTMVSDGRTQSNTEMLAFYKTAVGVTRFVGIDGVKLTASNVWKTKSEATVADQRASTIPKHPQFLLDATRLAAIDAYAQDIVTKFNAGQCPGQNGKVPTP